MATPASEKKVQNSGIRVLEARVNGFRSLNLVSVIFADLTLLIGENNSGKTSFLEAMVMAIGQGHRANFVDDIFLGPDEKQPPKERSAIVDLLIRPADQAGKVIDSFPAGSPWLELWGNGISQDEADNDFAAIRTVLKFDAGKGEYGISRAFLLDWPSKAEDMKKAKVNEKHGPALWSHVEPLSLFFMDAKRDIHDELHNRNSFWNKLVNDIGLTEGQISKLEQQLSEINDTIVASSKVLSHIQSHLAELYYTVTCEREGISITPLNRHLRDFRQGMDVQFATVGSQYFPLSRHGMGTRSLAAVLIFRAYMTWRQQQNGKDNALHPMLALEEPESHLHPQAQRALFANLDAIPGQRIVSSHSPYIVSQADIRNVRHFGKRGPETIVSALDMTDLGAEDIRKINRMVLNTRGDILFARALVLFEGETEEQALPIFAEHYWKRSVHAIGISFVGVGGDGNYLPFLRLAVSYGIPWFIFADGEATTIKRLATVLEKVGIPDLGKCPTVFTIPSGLNYEGHILNQGYQDAAATMLNAHHATKDYLSDFIMLMHGQKAKGGKIRDYKLAGGINRAFFDILSGSKTEYGAPLARSIVSLPEAKRQVPPLMSTMFEAMTKVLNLDQKKPAESEKTDAAKTSPPKGK